MSDELGPRAVSAALRRSVEELDELRADIEDELLGPGTPMVQAEVAPDDPRWERLVDCLGALAVIESDDPSFPWSLGTLLERAGRHAEAAWSFLEASRRSEAQSRDGTGAMGDEELWASTARWHACRCFIAAGLPAAAAATLEGMVPEERDEMRSILEGWL